MVAGDGGRRRPVRRERDPLARPQGVQHAQRVLHPGSAPSTSSPVPRRRRPAAAGCGTRQAPRRARVCRHVPAERFDVDGAASSCRRRARRAAGDTARRADLGTEWEWEESPRCRSSSPTSVDAPSTCSTATAPGSSPRCRRRRGRAATLLRRRRRPLRRRRLHPLGRRPVRPRHARARPVELAVRPAVRPRRRAVGRLGLHRPPPRHDRRPRPPPLTAARATRVEDFHKHFRAFLHDSRPRSDGRYR